MVQCFLTLPFTLAIFRQSGLYAAFGMERKEEVERIALCITGVQAASAGVFWLLRAAGGLAPVALGGLSIALVPIGRVWIRDVLSKKRRWSQSVILIHRGARPKDLAEMLHFSLQRGHYQTGVVSAGEQALGAAAGVVGFDTRHAAGTFGSVFINSADDQQLRSPLSRSWKRAMDVPIALTAGLVLLPLLATIIIAVKLTSPGRIFYGHPRIGKNNSRIRVWKFRTMVKDADVLLAERLAAEESLRIEWEQNHKLRVDPRLTPIGNFLRRYSLDELPQLWNVIKGDMSIVGPRPIIEAEIPKYAEYFADYMKVLPGITGLWQVSGRNETTYQQRVHLDSYYVYNCSLLLDLYIMLRTVKAVVSARGAY
jgi:lipopolysaccharide/colanic/teichoic acid biosynthesis glycosyltransferase